jgi:DNA-binding NtrC family response regulator
VPPLRARPEILSDHGELNLDGLPLPSAAAPAPPSAVPATMNLEELEKQMIQKAIAQHAGNLSKAAQSLGLGRTTLYRKMARYGLQ